MDKKENNLCHTVKKNVIRVGKKTIIIFAAIGAISTYKFVKKVENPFDNNIISDFKTGFMSLFNHDDTKEEEPSCTQSKTLEDMGKKIDEFNGDNTSWDKTSSPDTYGEAVSGVFGAFFNNGEYTTQKPTNEEMIKYIDEDLKEVTTKINADDKPEDFLESLKIVLSSFAMTDYQKVNFNDSVEILNNSVKFINGGENFHNKDIKFTDLDDNTKLYFIDNTLKMDQIIDTKYLNYKQELKNSNLDNMRNNLINLSNTIITENKEKQMRK